MTRRPRIGDLSSIAVPERPALSPDGARAVYVLRTCDTGADRNVRELWRVDVPAGRPRRLTRGPADTAPAWSPDGTRVAFLRAQDGPPQVWLLPADGGEPEPLTDLPLGAGEPVWSPDGSRIACTAAVGPAAGTGPVVADRLDYQADGLGLVGAMRRHLHVVDVATRRCRQVTDGDWHAGDPSWSPDGTRLAFSAATAPDADLTLRAPVHVIDIAQEAISTEAASPNTASPETALSEMASPDAASPDAASPETALSEVVGLAEGWGGTVAWVPDGRSLVVAGMTGAPVPPSGT